MKLTTLFISALTAVLLISACGSNSSTPNPAPVSSALSPAYTAWVVGDTADVKTQPIGGVLLAGGSTDVDAAMRWLLRRAAGGDVLIIRATGSSGYNKYLFNDLGQTVNSVETILLNSRELASNADILRKVRNAEAIFFAGGDQANYVNFYQGTPLNEALNERIRAGAVVGGTSAGCGILGGAYFTAKQGTIRSEEALANPYDARVDLRRDDFLRHPLLANVFADMHYNNPDRQGRHLTFMARALTDWAVQPRGIGTDEQTAVAITPDGAVRVFGRGNAYFLEAGNTKPETCRAGQPLTWLANRQAVRVWTVPGSTDGTTGFELVTFRPTAGSTAKTGFWYAENGEKK